VGRPPKSQIAERFIDWHGREVFLDKETLRDHIRLFHVEELLVIQQLKAKFKSPREVRENRSAGTEVAIYDIACNGKAHLVVAIEKRFPWNALSNQQPLRL
jgi:hypothetical protein